MATTEAGPSARAHRHSLGWDLHRPGAAQSAVALLGLGAAFIVGHDGTPGWQVLRVLGVAILAVVGIAAVGRPGQPRHMAVGLPLGIVGVGLGLGIGIPSASKGGSALLTTAGLVNLAGGLALLGMAVATPVRSLRGWRRALSVPAALVGTLVALYAVGLPLAVAVAATNVPRTAVGATTPADRGLAFSDVTFATTDGVLLSGWYLPSRNGAAVIALHGSGSTRSAVLGQAGVLAGAGYGVLAFDARGHGRSGGRAMDFGWYGDRDIAAAVSFLQARPDVVPGRIAALGLSMGGEEALGAMAAIPQIRVVVAEGATNRVTADKGWLSSVYGIQGWIQRGVEWATYGVASLLTDAPQPGSLRAAVARAAPRPVLLIAAGNVADETHADRFIQAASPGSVQLWTVPGAGHQGGLSAQPDAWRAHVLGFLDAALGTTG